MKYRIKDNGGRYYRAEIDDWTVAVEAATAYDSWWSLPDVILDGRLRCGDIPHCPDDTMGYYRGDALEAEAWTEAI